jgi:hypothetical protein
VDCIGIDVHKEESQVCILAAEGGYTPAPCGSAASAAPIVAASAELKATCCRKVTRTNQRRCLTRGAASQMGEWEAGGG